MPRLGFRIMGLALSIFEAYGCPTCIGLVLLLLLVVVGVVVGLLVYQFGVDYILSVLSTLLG
jgi:hypothetical protein